MSDQSKTPGNEEREYLKEQLEELGQAMAVIEELRKPFDRAMNAVYGVQEALLERHAAALYGTCEFCSEPLFEGDKGHPGGDDSGPLCENCAPTWGDIQKHWAEMKIEPDDKEMTEQCIEAFAAVKAHVDGGGSLDDKVLYTL